VHGRSDFKSFAMLVQCTYIATAVHARLPSRTCKWSVAGDEESKRCVQVGVMDGRR